MTTVFRLDSSIRTEGSVTRALADTLEQALTDTLDGDVTVVRRDLGADPLPSTLWSAAAFAGFTPEDQRSQDQREAVATASALGDELADADAAIFAVPFYNWGVSQHFKTWADVLITDSRFSAGAGAGAGKPAYLVVARGGGYSEGTPRYGWDHATEWLTRVLTDVWGFDLHIIETELTLAEVTPAMAGLVDQARQNLANAHDSARRSGTELAQRLSQVPAAVV